MITTFEKKIHSSSTIDEFFGLSQFHEDTEWGDRALPCTWEEIFDSTATRYSLIECLADFLNNNCPAEVTKYFNQRRDETDEFYKTEDLWQFLHSSEDDHSVMVLFIDETIEHLLKVFRSTTIGDLEDRYLLNYHARRKTKKEEEHAYQNEKDTREKISQEFKTLGESLWLEFKERLKKQVTLINPAMLRFSKDQEIWPMLKQTLDSFSEKERAAIIYVSQKSNSVELLYSAQPYLKT